MELNIEEYFGVLEIISYSITLGRSYYMKNSFYPLEIHDIEYTSNWQLILTHPRWTKMNLYLSIIHMWGTDRRP